MDRIATTTVSADLFGAGKDGFTSGNPNSQIAPTQLSAAWCNGVQEELIGCIEFAGLTPDVNSNTQLLQSLTYCAHVASNPDADDVIFPLQSEAEPAYAGGYFRKTDTVEASSSAAPLLAFFTPPSPSQGSVEYKITVARKISPGPQGTRVFRQEWRRLANGTYEEPGAPVETYTADSIGMTYELDYTGGSISVKVIPKDGEDPARTYRITVIGEITIIAQDAP